MFEVSETKQIGESHIDRNEDDSVYKQNLNAARWSFISFRMPLPEFCNGESSDFIRKSERLHPPRV